MPKDKTPQKKIKHCVFCDIVDHKRQKDDIVLQTEDIIVFHDASPASRHHLLSCPTQHIKDCKQLTKRDIGLVQQLHRSGLEALEKLGASTQDTRVGFHWPPFTSINHLHLHIISPVGGISCYNGFKYSLGTRWFVSVDEVIKHLEKVPDKPESSSEG